MLEPETGGAAAPNNAREQQVVAYNELLRQAGRGGAAVDPVLDRLNRARTLLRGTPVATSASMSFLTASCKASSSACTLLALSRTLG